MEDWDPILSQEVAEALRSAEEALERKTSTTRITTKGDEQQIVERQSSETITMTTTLDFQDDYEMTGNIEDALEVAKAAARRAKEDADVVQKVYNDYNRTGLYVESN